jgi:hypothetical protein
LGWNVVDSDVEHNRGYQKSNVRHSDPVFQEVSRMQMNRSVGERYDTHVAYRRMPEAYRRVLVCVYVLNIEAAVDIGEVLQWDRKLVVGIFGFALAEMELELAAQRRIKTPTEIAA